MDLKKLRVNGKRLQSTLEQMAKIGGTPGGGVQRLTLSDEDKQARDLFVKWLKEIDCEITIDEMGNIFGRRAGRNNALPPVMSGSHIDSQPKGGRFDGILGVMGALEVMRTLHENKVQTERPMVIVDWTNEEGSRFAPAMVGSGVWAGALKLDWVYDRKDITGKRLEDELARIGYKGTAPCRKFPVHCYYEFHIEQGPMLERQKKLIGAPKGILCLHWYDIYLTGEANQVGPTPMEGRHDALVAAAEMILKVRAAAGPHGRQHGGHRGRDPELSQLPQHHPGPRALYRGHPLLGRRACPARVGPAAQGLRGYRRQARLPDQDRGDLACQPLTLR